MNKLAAGALVGREGPGLLLRREPAPAAGEPGADLWTHTGPGWSCEKQRRGATSAVARTEPGWRRWAGPLLRGLLAEAQLGRQVGHVADGQAQRLDLGQSAAGRRQEAPEVVQGLGQIPHAQLLSLAGRLPLPAGEPGPGPPAAGAGPGAGLQALRPAARARGRPAAEEDAVQRSSLEGRWREAEGVHRRRGRQAAAGADVARVHQHVLEGRVQRGLAVEEQRVVLELEGRAVGDVHAGVLSQAE